MLSMQGRNRLPMGHVCVCATPGGEKADDEKSLRNYDGDPQGGESDRNAGVEEQGVLHCTIAFVSRL